MQPLQKIHAQSLNDNAFKSISEESLEWESTLEVHLDKARKIM